MITIALLAFSLTVSEHAMTCAQTRVAAASAQISFRQLSEAADRARTENRDDEAIRLYKRALAVRPEWEQGLWYLGTLHYGREQYADARDVLRRFVALRPDAGPGWALLGMSEFQTRQYSRALDHLQRAMAQGMGDRADMVQSAFYFAAVVLTRLERYDDSMSMLLRMSSLNQDRQMLIEPAGLAALRMPLLPGEIPEDRRNMVRMTGEAVVSLQTQHYEDADQKFKQLEAAYPNEPGVHFVYGAYLMQLHPDDGIREMKRELQISPYHVLARVRIAEQYLQQEQFDQAMPLAQEAVQLDPRRSSAHMILGEAYVGKGDLTHGIKELEIARDDDPMETRTHWDLLRAFTATGRVDDARREKEEIQRLTTQAAAAHGAAENGTPGDQRAPN
jgi:tetratricopeptide (TPR) repeat protein